MDKLNFDLELTVSLEIGPKGGIHSRFLYSRFLKYNLKMSQINQRAVLAS